MVNPSDEQRHQELLAQLKALPTEPPAKARPKAEDVTDLSMLPDAVRAIRLGKGKPFLLREDAADLVIGCLLNRGKLIRGSDGHRFSFFDAANSEACTPDFTANGAALTRLIDLASISDNGAGGLTIAEQKTLLRTWYVFHQFAYKTRLILAAQGEPGSGKTSACQNLCMV